MGNAETGQTWTPLSATTWGIQSNQAYCPGPAANNKTATCIDAGVANATVKVTCSVLDAPGLSSRVFARLSDVDNCLRFDNDGNAPNNILYRVQAGTPTSIAGPAAAGASGDVIEIVCAGNSISVKRNGSVILGPVTEAFNNTATKYGIGQVDSAAAARFDNFSVT